MFEFGRPLFISQYLPSAYLGSRMKQCKPFVIAGFQLGLITPEVEEVLKEYAQVFVIKDQCVTLVDTLNTYDSRTKAVAAVLKDMRSQDKFLTLRGWRDEVSQGLFYC